MAYVKATVTYHRTTGLPADDVVNSYHFFTDEGETLGEDTAAAIAGRLAANLFDAGAAGGTGAKLHTFMSAEVSRVALPTIDVYHAQDGGSPIATATMAGLQAPSATDRLPSEAACCLSFRGAYTDLQEYAENSVTPDPDDFIRPRARVRGRVFFGPLSAGAVQEIGGLARPHLTFVAALANLGTKLLQFNDTLLSNGVQATWAAYSRTADFMTPVTEAWVDDAFDTQRRRGVAPSSRTIVS